MKSDQCFLRLPSVTYLAILVYIMHISIIVCTLLVQTILIFNATYFHKCQLFDCLYI